MENSFWITKDKRAYVWGRNKKGELGLGHKNPVYQPTLLPPPKKSPWKWFAFGYSHVFGMTRSGELYAWGCNAVGQLGMKLLRGQCEISTPQLLLPPGNSPWEKIYCGSFFTIGVTVDGKSYAWGDDSYCQVSGATGKVYDDSKYKEYKEASSSRNDVKRHFSTPECILPQNGSLWKTFACGEHHVVGIANNGLSYGWGSNEYWQTGGATKRDRTVHLLPVPKDHQDSEWVQFACGSNFTIGMTKCGIVAMWKNLYSAKEPFVSKIESHVPWDRFYTKSCIGIMVLICRDNTTYISLPPMKDQIDPVLQLTPTPSPGHHWKSFVPGFHTLCTSSSGDLKVWGLSPYGALGLGQDVKALQKPDIIPPPRGTTWEPKSESFINPTFKETFRTIHEDLIKISLLPKRGMDKNISRSVSSAYPLISLRCPPFLDLVNIQDMPFEAITQLLMMIFGFQIFPQSIEYSSFKKLQEFVTKHHLVDFEDDITYYLFRSYPLISRHIMDKIESEGGAALFGELKDIDEIEKRQVDTRTDRRNFSWYIKNLFYKKHETNMTICVDDFSIDVHQFVLRAKSKFFRKLLRPDQKKNSINIYDQLGLSLSSMNILLEYFYLGYVSTKMTKTNAKQLLKAQKIIGLNKKDDVLFYVCKDVLR